MRSGVAKSGAAMAVIVILLASLSACGRKGAPEALPEWNDPPADDLLLPAEDS